MGCVRAIEWVAEDGLRECRNCGAPLTGFGDTLRHDGEAVARVMPEPRDARALERARSAIEAELRTLPQTATPVDAGVAALNALYRGGFLRRHRGERKATPLARDADHAERAANDVEPGRGDLLRA